MCISCCYMFSDLRLTLTFVDTTKDGILPALCPNKEV